MEPFDVLRRSEEVEKAVMHGDNRLYYRFRYAEFYGGIITCDSVGCNLLCAYCWNFEKNQQPEGAKGLWCSPLEVAQKIDVLLKKHPEVERCRVSGCEAILGHVSAKHLAEVIEKVPSDIEVIIETNGIIIGADPTVLTHFRGLEDSILFRVAIKADSPELFEKVTGAKGEAFAYQIAALEALANAGIPRRYAYMEKFAKSLHMPAFRGEKEPLKRYPNVNKRLKERGL